MALEKLVQEHCFFKAFHDEIVKGHLGEYVVIKGNAVIGYYKGLYDGVAEMERRHIPAETYAAYPCTEQFPSIEVWSPGVIA